MCDCDMYWRDLDTPVKVDTGINHTFAYQSGSESTTLIAGISMPRDIEYNRAAWKIIRNEHGLKTGVMLVFGEKADD